MWFGLNRLALCAGASIVIVVPSLSASVSVAQDVKSSEQVRRASDISFEGRTIRLTVGSAAGGTTDQVSRIVAKHLREELPGHPTFLIQNMPGAASLLATNSILRPAADPALAIVSVNHELTLQQATGNPNMAYDLRKVNWLGSVSTSPKICAARTDSGVATIEDARTHELRMAGTTAGGGQTVVPLIVNSAIGTRFKVIKGYQGIAEALLAVERGETDGICVAMIGTALNWIKRGFARPLIVLGTVPPAEKEWVEAVKGVPNVSSLLANSPKRPVMDALLQPTEMVYAYAVNQNAPAEEVRTFRAAFDRAVRRQDFKDDLAAEGDLYAPKTADEVLSIVTRILSIDPNVAAELKQILEQ